jgi:hypothetical protein
VWISEEPFGWATYHYGKWFYDRYDGWVWLPGLDWGPAWVSWEQTPDYVGWSPQLPAGVSGATVPGGSYLFVPTAQLPATDLKTQILTSDRIGAKLGVAQPVHEEDQRDGVRFNRGPNIAAIERLTGPLDRVKIEDAALAGGAGAKPDTKVTPAPPQSHEAQAPMAPSGAGVRAQIEALRKAGEEQAEAARWTRENKTPPPLRLQVFRHLKQQAGQPSERKAPSAAKRKAAPTDSTHRH